MKSKVFLNSIAVRTIGLILLAFVSHLQAGELIDRSDWEVSASHNSENAANAIDSDVSSRWTTEQKQRPNQSFTIDMQQAIALESIVMTTESGRNSIGDYPRGFTIELSQDGTNFGNPIARGTGSESGTTTVALGSQTARYIKVTQTGSTDRLWWSIHDLNVIGSLPSQLIDRSGWEVSASRNSVNAINAIDGDVSSRWTTEQKQRPGQSFTIDMQQGISVASIIMVTENGGNSIGDYPRGFTVELSLDGTNFSNLVRGAGSGSGTTEIELESQTARYIRVTQTGSTDRLWWSIHDLNVVGFPTNIPTVDTPIVNTPEIEPPVVDSNPVSDEPSTEQAAQFLMAASFGPTQESIDELVDQGFSEWFLDQESMPIRTILADTNPNFSDRTNIVWEGPAREAWYERAIAGDDQLRQRAAFALSQIFVVSTEPRDWLFKSHLHARYMDIMQESAFGNFRDLLEEVTYSPLMGEWLTYIGSERANAQTGSMPDENYAREIMQLFSIGLVDLNQDGTPRTEETYTLDDISGLSRVFTGLWWAGRPFGRNETREAERAVDIERMVMHDNFHSPEEKTFLGHTIPAGTPGDESIRQALDIIFTHPNVAPFISRQLIQRITASNPEPDYVRRVADTFDRGTFTLPDGREVGTGIRGDLAPVWAAIIFDPEAHAPDRVSDESWGKVREPLIRWIHWARASDLAIGSIEIDRDLRREALNAELGQNPFRADSVFNFFRPGFVAGGTNLAEQGLVAPELQITTSATAIHYPNFMQRYVLRDRGSWLASYDVQVDMAEDPEALVEHLDLVMTGGRMTDRTKERISETISSVAIPARANRQAGARRDRVQLAMLLTVTSQEYNTQQ